MKTSKIIVSRFEYSPIENPIKVIVGFTIKCPENNKNHYIEVMIPIEDAVDKTEFQIVRKAFRRKKTKIALIENEVKATPSILNAEFIPDTDDRTSEDPELP